MLNKLFKLDQNKTSIKTEHISGLTMFMTVACMLAAKLGVSSASCMPKCGVFFALTLFGGTLLTMVLSKHQFFHAPGKGLNVFSRLLFA